MSGILQTYLALNKILAIKKQRPNVFAKCAAGTSWTMHPGQRAMVVKYRSTVMVVYAFRSVYAAKITFTFIGLKIG